MCVCARALDSRFVEMNTKPEPRAHCTSINFRKRASKIATPAHASMAAYWTWDGLRSACQSEVCSSADFQEGAPTNAHANACNPAGCADAEATMPTSKTEHATDGGNGDCVRCLGNNVARRRRTSSRTPHPTLTTVGPSRMFMASLNGLHALTDAGPQVAHMRSSRTSPPRVANWTRATVPQSTRVHSQSIPRTASPLRSSTCSFNQSAASVGSRVTVTFSLVSHLIFGDVTVTTYLDALPVDASHRHLGPQGRGRTIGENMAFLGCEECVDKSALSPRAPRAHAPGCATACPEPPGGMIRHVPKAALRVNARSSAKWRTEEATVFFFEYPLKTHHCVCKNPLCGPSAENHKVFFKGRWARRVANGQIGKRGAWVCGGVGVRGRARVGTSSALAAFPGSLGMQPRRPWGMQAPPVIGVPAVETLTLEGIPGAAGIPTPGSASSPSTSPDPMLNVPFDTFLLNMFLSVVLFVCIFLTANLYNTAVVKSLEKDTPKKWRHWLVAIGVTVFTLGLAVLIQQLTVRKIGGVNVDPQFIVESANSLATAPSKGVNAHPGRHALLTGSKAAQDRVLARLKQNHLEWLASCSSESTGSMTPLQQRMFDLACSSVDVRTFEGVPGFGPPAGVESYQKAS